MFPTLSDVSSPTSLRIPFDLALSVSSRVPVTPTSPSSSVSKAPLRILLLTNAYNSMCQAIHLSLIRSNHVVMIEFAITPEHMVSKVKSIDPDLIICPFLTKRVLPDIYNKYTTIIVHPGVKGDRGMSSLDWVLLTEKSQAGVTLMSAEEEMDAGPIWSTKPFQLQRFNACGQTKPTSITKSSLYKHEIIQAALSCLSVTLERLERGIAPVPLDYNDPTTLGTLLPTMKQSDHIIDWTRDNATEVARIVRSRDTQPGVLVNNMFGMTDIWIYGAHVENAFTIKEQVPYLQQDPTLKHIYQTLITSPPQTILAKRHDAILISCANHTAVWITHMKLHNNNTTSTSCQPTSTPYFKLPSCYVLPSSLMSSIPTWDIPLVLSPLHDTFREIWCEIEERVCYVYFEFYNGAMNTSQCERLRDVLVHIKTGKINSLIPINGEIKGESTINTIVLMGGTNFFSNGIHLNTIQFSNNAVQESINNINAMNQVCLQIMDTPNHTTVAVFRGNAGAGGVMMGIACDHVISHSNVIFNPHYKSMGLYGSEYWTFNLPKRVGPTKAHALTDAMLPIDAFNAKQCGLIDQIAGADTFSLSRVLPGLCRDISNNVSGIWDRFISRKYSIVHQEVMRGTGTSSTASTARDTWLTAVEHHRQQEMVRMRENFMDLGYIEARTRFVHKICKSVTPLHLAVLGGRQVVVDGGFLSSKILNAVTAQLGGIKAANPNIRPPGLCIIRVGDDRASNTYVRLKEKKGIALGYHVKHIHMMDTGDAASMTRDIMKCIEENNNDDSIDGVMVQLPLPHTLLNQTYSILNAIKPDKDVDGLRTEKHATYTNTNSTINTCTPLSVNCVPQQHHQLPNFVPATVRAIMHILSSYDVPLPGKNVVVVGSGPLVGAPCAELLMKRKATVTVANVHTQHLENYVKQADIVIAAAGVPGLIRASWLKVGSVVIDVGGCGVGEVEPISSINSHHGLVTPVPNGVGPITVAMLLQQTLEAYLAHRPQAQAKSAQPARSMTHTKSDSAKQGAQTTNSDLEIYLGNNSSTPSNIPKSPKRPRRSFEDDHSSYDTRPAQFQRYYRPQQHLRTHPQPQPQPQSWTWARETTSAVQ